MFQKCVSEKFFNLISNMNGKQIEKAKACLLQLQFADIKYVP